MEDPMDAAAEAFERLRADVAKLIAMTEVIRSTGTIDYSPTLGKIVNSLAAIEAHPAMTITPTSYQQQLTSSIEGVRYRLEGELRKSIDAVGRASSDLQGAIGIKREREAQRNWLVGTCALGVVVGFLAYAFVVGPAARALPASWHAPETLAAETMHQDFWQAGAELMQTGNPSSWAAMLQASRLQQKNLPALQACFNAVQRAGRPLRCTIIAPTEP